MLRLEILIELIADLSRALLVDELSERVRHRAKHLSRDRPLRGMVEVRRHFHRQCQRRLRDRLSTGKG